MLFLQGIPCPPPPLWKISLIVCMEQHIAFVWLFFGFIVLIAGIGWLLCKQVARLALLIYGLCILNWKVNNVKAGIAVVLWLVNCHYWKCLSQGSSRILQTREGDNDIPLECLCLLCGCSGCSCEKAIKAEKWSCASDLLTAMRGFSLHSYLFLFLSFFLLSSPSSSFHNSRSKSHLFKWGKMIIVMDAPLCNLSPALLRSPLCTLCFVH